VVLLAGPAFSVLVWGTRSDHAVLAAVVVASLVLAPYRMAATVGLERDLLFGRIVAIELAEHLVYGGTALVLARAGHGVTALAAAVLARSLAGVIAAAALSPWRPRLSLELSRVRPLLRFGIAYQTTAIVHVLSGLVAPVLVGRHGGDAALGLALWAHGNADRPRPVLEAVTRVAFPSYARLGATPDVLRSGFERSFHASLLTVGLYSGLLLGCAPLVVRVLYTEKWMEGVPLLYVFLLVAPVATLTIMLDVAFLASGRSDRVRNFHLVRLVLSWSLAVPATSRFGAAGYAGAYAAAMGGFALVELAWARRVVPLASILRSGAGPLLAAAAAAAASRETSLAGAAWPGLLVLSIAAIAGAAAFFAVELAIDRPRFRASVSSLLERGR
jgi:O-antigen/teichoic acid export membrane protein